LDNFVCLIFFFFGIIVALRLGLPFVPSYLEQAGAIEDMIHGVNYASSGAGIIFSSGSDLVNNSISGVVFSC